jgi:hypothetical protein
MTALTAAAGVGFVIGFALRMAYEPELAAREPGCHN